MALARLHCLGEKGDILIKKKLNVKSLSHCPSVKLTGQWTLYVSIAHAGVELLQIQIIFKMR